MAQPEAVVQLARILGRDRVQHSIGPDPYAGPLTPDRLAALRRLVDERLDTLARGLAEEAAANDDVTSPDAAEEFLEDRLAFFNDLLTPAQRDRVRDAYRAYSARWG